MSFLLYFTTGSDHPGQLWCDDTTPFDRIYFRVTWTTQNHLQVRQGGTVTMKVTLRVLSYWSD